MRPASKGSKSRPSTSINRTCLILKPRLTKHSARSTISSGPARSATSAARIMPHGSSRWHSEPANRQDLPVTTRFSLATTCFIGRSRPSCFRSAATRAWASIVYNPLAGGLLSGKHRPDQPPPPEPASPWASRGELYRDRYWQSAQFEAVETLRSASLRSGNEPGLGRECRLGSRPT